MFVAKSENGMLISLLDDWNKNQLVQLRTNGSFTCPSCNQTVQLRLGDQRIWHFAHLKDRQCSHEMEPESDYHLSGKKQLYEWAKKYHKYVQLEPYLKDLHQRPDILVTSAKGQQIAIEYQCSPISKDLFMKRTTRYEQFGIIPIWILGGKRLKRIGKTAVQLQKFDWLFTRHLYDRYTIFFYCPRTQKFIYLSELTPFSTSKTLSALSIHSNQHFPFTNLFNFPTKRQLHKENEWLSIKKHWRYQPVHYRASYLHRYMNKVYLSKGISISLFPAEAGIPSPSHFFIETPCFLWQSWILTVFLDKYSTNQAFQLNHLYYSFQTMVSRGLFKIRSLPKIKITARNCPIKDYLLALCKLGVLENIQKSTFVKRKVIQYPPSFEHAFKWDRQVLTKVGYESTKLIK